MKLDELQYYKIKAQLLELQVQENQLMRTFDRIRKQREALFSSLELDPSKNYTFTDDGCTIEEAENGIR